MYMKIVIFDNFFKDPDAIRNFALGLEYHPRKSHQFFEGVRSAPLHTLDYELYTSVCYEIISSYYGPGNWKYEGPIFFHQTRECDKHDTQWLNDRIHQDKAIIAGIVYLTPGAPLACGTQTYQKIEEEYHPDVIMGNRYNRLIIFNSDQYHSASSFFGEDQSARLCMLIFIEKIEKID